MAIDLDRIRAALADRLPDGYDVANLVVLPVEGQASLAAVAAGPVRTAAIPLINDQDKPTRIQIDAWMAHADVPNLNGQMFTAEDLQRLGGALAAAPDFLVMDWNHSAVMPWRDGPKAIGTWYQVTYEHDPAANNGRGAYGLRAQGTMWAWLFPDQANILMGEQARNGYATFSMACIAKRKSYQTDSVSGAEVTVLHEPVFFTLSALDVMPADPDARGRLSMATHAAATAAKTPEEPGMTDTEIQALEAAKADLEAKVEELTQHLNEGKTTTESMRADLEGRLAALETSHAEQVRAKEALATELAALQASHEAALAALQAAEAKVAEQEALRASEEAAKVLHARLASLPEAFRAAHAAREDEMRARIEQKWMQMSDVEWEQYKAEELLFGLESASLRYSARSHAEGGILPTGGTPEVELKSRATRITK